MLKTNNPLLLVPFRYGGLGLLFNIAALVVLFLIGRHPLLLNPVLDARIPLYALIIFASFKAFKDNYNKGIMHFWQGLAMGIVAYLIMAVGTSIFIYIVGSVESTGFLAEYIRIASGQLEANKELFIESIGEKTYNETMYQLPLTRPVHLALDYLLKSTPIGLFLTLLLSILMRRKINN